MIATAIKMEGDEKDIMTGMIANQMKKSYILFNESSVDNNMIRLHLKQMSNNQLALADDFKFIHGKTHATAARADNTGVAHTCA